MFVIDSVMAPMITIIHLHDLLLLARMLLGVFIQAES